MSPTALPREAQVDEVKDLITRGKEQGFLTSDEIAAGLA
ncbi:MAG: polymerase primary sigma factor, partial [Frankiales bacterium]|nr:polymerase primary sigma factor [Frankiales bacterium]